MTHLRKDKVFILSIFILYLFACGDKSTTIVKGTVINDITGNPIPNINVVLMGDTYSYPYVDVYSSDITDKDGKYYVSVTGNDISHASLYIYNYNSNYVDFSAGVPVDEKTTKNIFLSPFDSYLTFKIKNDQMINDSIYGEYRFIKANHSWSITDPVPFGTEYIKGHRVTGNNYIYINWGLSPNDYKLHKDSIYVNSGDSVVYNITM